MRSLVFFRGIYRLWFRFVHQALHEPLEGQSLQTPGNKQIGVHEGVGRSQRPSLVLCQKRVEGQQISVHDETNESRNHDPLGHCRVLNQVEEPHAVKSTGRLRDTRDENVAGGSLEGHESQNRSINHPEDAVKEPVGVREAGHRFQERRTFRSGLENLKALVSDHPHKRGDDIDSRATGRPEHPKNHRVAGFHRKKVVVSNAPEQRRCRVEKEHRRRNVREPLRQIRFGLFGCLEDPDCDPARHDRQGVIGSVGPHGVVEHRNRRIVIVKRLGVDFFADCSARKYVWEVFGNDHPQDAVKYPRCGRRQHAGFGSRDR
mmetsp:Transcript_24586/g.54137  ORF Transcript_24586/g.54137 Transcript_24586/m.54137 type:complete len:317 (+) Transcript_24586:1542-2492(+)